MLNLLYKVLRDADRISDVLSITGLAASTYYSKKGLDQTRRYQNKSIDLGRRQHLMETFSELEQHFIQLDADLVNATKESERDVYDQRNQQLQTLILSCTVMFSALSTIIVQGNLPDSSERVLIVLFSLFNGFSFACLLCCLVLCIEILALSSRFMICRSNFHTERLDETRANTSKLFNVLRKKEFTTLYPSQRNLMNPAEQIKEEHKSIAEIDSEQLEKHWKGLEEGSARLLDTRRKLIGKMIDTETFDNFWKTHCKDERKKAVAFFYLGTGLMLLSIIIYVIAQFIHQYNSPVGAVLGAGLIFISLVWGCVLKMQVSSLHPESYFYHVGKRVEVTDSNILKLLFFPEYCKWKPATIAEDEANLGTPRSEISRKSLENRTYISVRILPTLGPQMMPVWRIRDTKDEAQPLPPAQQNVTV